MVVFPKEIVTEDFILRAVIHKCYAPKLVTLVSKKYQRIQIYTDDGDFDNS